MSIKKPVISYTPDLEEARFVELLNAYRTDKGLRPLALNHRLGARSVAYAQTMATQNIIRHLSQKTIEKQIERTGYRFFIWREILNAGFATAEQALGAWQTSPSHHAAMLHPKLRDIGVGRASSLDDEHFDWYWAVTLACKH